MLRSFQPDSDVRCSNFLSSLHSPIRSNSLVCFDGAKGQATLQVIEKIGGASRARTDDLIVANDGVCQSIAFVCLEFLAEYGPFRSNSVPQKSRLPGVCLNYRAQIAPIEALPKNRCCTMSLVVIK
jgi:hypothetical protein